MTRPLLELAAEDGRGRGDGRRDRRVVLSFTFKESSAWHREGLPLARAARASAESFFHSQKSSLPLDLLLADPPRAGLSPEVRRGILRLAPPHVLMVSCDPPTLARDLAALGERYAVTRLTLLDLFPQTHHVETVALLAARPIG